MTGSAAVKTAASVTHQQKVTMEVLRQEETHLTLGGGLNWRPLKEQELNNKNDQKCHYKPRIRPAEKQTGLQPMVIEKLFLDVLV